MPTSGWSGLWPSNSPTDGAYTYLPPAGPSPSRPGARQADTVVELDPEEWCAYVWELRSCFAMLYADRMSVVRGTFGQLVRWEPPLRVAFDGQGIYDIDVPPPVEDGRGIHSTSPRTFTLDDPPDEIADFLHGAGFVHLRQVMDEDEVEALRADVDQAVAMARPDDRRSWWTTVDGNVTCATGSTTSTTGRSGSPASAATNASPGLPHWAGPISGTPGPAGREQRGHQGSRGHRRPGRSPWHRDCGMGGHPVKCPMLNVGIQLDAATAATGQLLMIAGSHRGTSRLPRPKETPGAPGSPAVDGTG